MPDEVKSYAFKPKPASIEIESTDGKYKAVIDLYDAWFMLDEAFKSPSQDARWLAIKQWIANKLGCTAEEVSTTFAFEFNNYINEQGKGRQEELKKMNSEVVS